MGDVTSHLGFSFNGASHLITHLSVITHWVAGTYAILNRENPWMRVRFVELICFRCWCHSAGSLIVAVHSRTAGRCHPPLSFSMVDRDEDQLPGQDGSQAGVLVPRAGRVVR